MLPLFLAASTVVARLGNNGPIITTDDGPIQGTSKDQFTTYHGVPFAAEVDGSLRFKRPHRPTPWTAVKQTTEPGPQCPQFDFIKGIHIGKEDCLHLSVYVPEGCTPAEPCPVMQWIFGGAWIIGSNEEFGSYDGTKLAKNNGVIVVAANYRVDVFGWLALDELEAEDDAGAYGNYGLADQTLAMQWTQRNIAKFGGDPNKVTVFGESAGGFSVCQHIVRPESNHLFSHAIVESGDCDGPWLVIDGERAKKFGNTYATAVGCDGLHGTNKLDCLRNTPLEDLMTPYIQWFCFLNGAKSVWCPSPSGNTTVDSVSIYTAAKKVHGKDWPTSLPPFAPVCAWTAVVDGSSKGLPALPYDLMLQGKINTSPLGEKISVIMGTNHDELALFLIAMPITLHKPLLLPLHKAGFGAIVDHLVSYHDNWNSSTADTLLAAFPSSDYRTESERFVQAGTDIVFRCGTRNAVQALTSAGVNVYLYSFEYHGQAYRDPSSALCALGFEIGCGVYHTAEMKYVFGNFYIPHRAKDHAMLMSVQKYWTSLAKHGAPSGLSLGSADAVDVLWPVYSLVDDEHLVLTNPIAPGHGLAKRACDSLARLPR
jgi:carboxylesterase type B